MTQTFNLAAVRESRPSPSPSLPRKAFIFSAKKVAPMYKVIRTDLTSQRPKWLIMLLIKCKPTLIGKTQSLHCCQVIMRYFRFCAHYLFNGRKTDKVYIQESANELVLCNSRRKPCISFKIVESNDYAR